MGEIRTHINNHCAANNFLPRSWKTIHPLPLAALASGMLLNKVVMVVVIIRLFVVAFAQVFASTRAIPSRTPQVVFWSVI